MQTAEAAALTSVSTVALSSQTSGVRTLFSHIKADVRHEPASTLQHLHLNQLTQAQLKLSELTVSRLVVTGIGAMKAKSAWTQQSC